MTTVVISQPMFFPWVGMLEQLQRADVYVHYDDVQFSKGSFTNRVQVKTATGVKWLTVPLEDAHFGMLIKDVKVDSRRDWRKSHLDLLKQAYRGCDAMLELVARVYAVKTPWLCEVAIASMVALADAFGVRPAREVLSSELGLQGHGTARVLATVKAFGGTRYVSGAGGRAYLDHDAFERAGVAVEYMAYAKRPYPQRHGEFTPFVSALDLLANCGPDGRALFTSQTLSWKEPVS
ncbi:MAG: WbqC family protein [Archangiaceae bacterium]|nr:WbqC family protein [Archangiaceae bacterium]